MKKAIFKDYGKCFDRWRWEWFVTLTFRNPITKERALSQLKEWNLLLCKTESVQTAYVAVVNSTGWTPHIHILMMGKNRHGKILLDVSTEKWQEHWSYTHISGHYLPRRADIQVVRSNWRASRYLATNMKLWNPERYELVFYNKKLLAKCSPYSKIILD